MGVEKRLFAAGAALSTWLLLILIGWVGGGSVHLLLLAAALIFPWSAVPSGNSRDQGAWSGDGRVALDESEAGSGSDSSPPSASNSHDGSVR